MTKETTKVKSVTSITFRKPGTGTSGTPIEFTEIPPNRIFDCPNGSLAELRASGAITDLAKLTPAEAKELAPAQEGSEGADDPDQQDTAPVAEPVKLAAQKTEQKKPVATGKGKAKAVAAEKPAEPDADAEENVM